MYVFYSSFGQRHMNLCQPSHCRDQLHSFTLNCLYINFLQYFSTNCSFKFSVCMMNYLNGKLIGILTINPYNFSPQNLLMSQCMIIELKLIVYF